MAQSILITGCSSGIGLCAAQTLHRMGYRVFAGTRKKTDAQKLTELGLNSIELDLDNSQSIEQAIHCLLDQTGGTLDAVFNNAGFVQAGAVEDITRPMIRAQFETNVFGTLELTNRIIPIMRQQGHGRIIQNTSILGIVPMPLRGAYNASKFALEGLSQTLRQELHGSGIHVSMIVPGPIRSSLRQNALEHYRTHLQDKQSVHHTTYERMEKHFFTANSRKDHFAGNADAVVRKLIIALTAKRPRAHYYVTFPAHFFALLRRILPDSLLDCIMRNIHHSELNMPQ